MSLEKFLDSRLARNLRNTVGTARAVMFLAGVVLVASSLAYAAANSIGIDPDLATGLLVGVLSAAVALLMAWYIVSRFYDPPQYEILEIEATLTIESQGQYRRFTYVKRQKVRAVRNSLRLIEFRTHWTGRERVVEVESLNSDHVLLDGVVPEVGHRVFRWIYPAGPVGRGEVLEAGIRQVHDDELARQRPYYREGGGRYRTRKLTAIARFPIGEEPHPVEGCVWSTRVPVGEDSRVGTAGYHREINRDTGTVSYIVEVKHPKRHHSYGLRWHWPS